MKRHCALELCTNLAICGFICFSGTIVSARIIAEHYNGVHGSGGTFSSPAFPEPYQLEGDIYLVHLSNTEAQPSGFVQIEFTDFFISDKSILYIYDVDRNNQTTTGSVYGAGEWPVYHSTGQSLRLIFKTGTGHPSDVYVGFKATYTFVNYPRVEWPSHGLPSYGACGSTRSLGDTSGYSVTGAEGLGSVTHISCVWTLDLPSTVNLVVELDNQAESPVVVVRQGHTSLSPVLLPTTRPWSGTQVFVGSRFFITLVGTLPGKTPFVFAYNDNVNEAIKIALEKKKLLGDVSCQYKKCLKSDKCLLYWEPCADTYPTSDSSCDSAVPVKPCRLQTRCYSTVDVCDNFKDCPDSKDEDNCGLGLGLLVAIVIISVLLVVIIITAVMCLLFRRKKGKAAVEKEKRRAHLSDAILKGMCCSNQEKQNTAGVQSTILNGASCEKGVSNHGLECSNGNLNSYTHDSNANTMPNGGLFYPTDGSNHSTEPNKLSGGQNSSGLEVDSVDGSGVPSMNTSYDNVPSDQLTGVPNYDWLSFLPDGRTKSGRKKRQKEPPKTLILPRPLSFPTAIVLTNPSPEGNTRSHLYDVQNPLSCEGHIFTIESPLSCEEVTSFMTGTGLDPLSPSEKDQVYRF